MTKGLKAQIILVVAAFIFLAATCAYALDVLVTRKANEIVTNDKVDTYYSMDARERHADARQKTLVENQAFIIQEVNTLKAKVSQCQR